MTSLWRAVRDPFVASVAVLVGMAAGGFVGIATGWRGAAASLDVAVQLPYIVSGVLGGLSVIGFSAGLVLIQLRRREEARRRADVQRVVEAAAELLGSVRGRRS